MWKVKLSFQLRHSGTLCRTGVRGVSFHYQFRYFFTDSYKNDSFYADRNCVYTFVCKAATHFLAYAVVHFHQLSGFRIQYDIAINSTYLHTADSVVKVGSNRSGDGYFVRFTGAYRPVFSYYV